MQLQLSTAESLHPDGGTITLSLGCNVKLDVDQVEPHHADVSCFSSKSHPCASLVKAEPVEPLTPTPSRLLGPRSLPTASQVSSPTSTQWNDDVSRSSSAPPSLHTASTRVVEDVFPTFGGPARPESRNATCMRQITPTDRSVPRDSGGLHMPVHSDHLRGGCKFDPSHESDRAQEKLQSSQSLAPLSSRTTTDEELLLAGVSAYDSKAPVPMQSSTDRISPTGSGTKTQTRWWRVGPSPYGPSSYRQTPLKVVRTELSFDKPVHTSRVVPTSVHSDFHRSPTQSCDRLSHLDAEGEETDDLEAASTPYLSASSTPVDSTASQSSVPDLQKLAPPVKSKSKDSARQLLELQAYSTSILGGDVVMSAKRTRRRDDNDTVRTFAP